MANDLGWVFKKDKPEGMPHWAKSLRDSMVFWTGDWSSNPKLAWTWGIIIGWDDECLSELSNRFDWDPSQVALLKRLRADYVKDTGGPNE